MHLHQCCYSSTINSYIPPVAAGPQSFSTYNSLPTSKLHLTLRRQQSICSTVYNIPTKLFTIESVKKIQHLGKKKPTKPNDLFFRSEESNYPNLNLSRVLEVMTVPGERDF